MKNNNIDKKISKNQIMTLEVIFRTIESHYKEDKYKIDYENCFPMHENERHFTIRDGNKLFIVDDMPENYECYLKIICYDNIYDEKTITKLSSYDICCDNIKKDSYCLKNEEKHGLFYSRCSENFYWENKKLL